MFLEIAFQANQSSVLRGDGAVYRDACSAARPCRALSGWPAGDFLIISHPHFTLEGNNTKSFPLWPHSLHFINSLYGSGSLIRPSLNDRKSISPAT